MFIDEKNMVIETTANSTLIFFLHLPKTGGTTLNSIIKRQYLSHQILSIDQQFNTTIQAPQMSKSELSKLKIVKGHFSFGYHQFFSRPFTYFTMLRNPVDRVISDYYHIIRVPQHKLHNQIISQNMSLKDYVCSGISRMSENGQTKFLSGQHTEIGFNQCSSEILELAKNNLKEHFIVVGITEKFNESLILLKRAFKWDFKKCLYIKQRVGNNRISKNDIPIKSLKLIQKYNQFDLELYHYGIDIFNELKEINEIDFQVKKLVFFNKIYGDYYAKLPNFAKSICQKFK